MFTLNCLRTNILIICGCVYALGANCNSCAMSKDLGWNIAKRVDEVFLHVQLKCMHEMANLAPDFEKLQYAMPTA